MLDTSASSQSAMSIWVTWYKLTNQIAVFLCHIKSHGTNYPWCILICCQSNSDDVIGYDAIGRDVIGGVVPKEWSRDTLLFCSQLYFYFIFFALKFYILTIFYLHWLADIQSHKCFIQPHVEKESQPEMDEEAFCITSNNCQAGRIPDIEFYDPDGMKPEKKEELLHWHSEPPSL